jgi:glycosyltransferase involved in cell wall biosynthesis
MGGERVFICGEQGFPRGTAGANYIHYFALAVQAKGKTPIVISNGVNHPADYQKEADAYFFRGIRYQNYEYPTGKISHFISANFGNGQAIIAILKRFKVRDADSVVIYTSNYFTAAFLLRYLRMQAHTRIAMCVVEWHQPFQYRYGIFNYKYWNNAANFHLMSHRIGRIIPISAHLDKLFQSRGYATLRLPIMADPFEFAYERNTAAEVPADDRIQFIYSGNWKSKDLVGNMLQAFSKMDPASRMRIRVNITGISKMAVRKLLGNNQNVIDVLGDMLIIHDWLEYDELVALYRKMDFLFIARDVNTVTLSNFPSKVPEMMNHGVIPVVSIVGDYTKDYLSDGQDSILFEGCSIEACQGAIARAMSLTAAERGVCRDNARKCVIERFWYAKWADAIDSFLFDDLHPIHGVASEGK